MQQAFTAIVVLVTAYSRSLSAQATRMATALLKILSNLLCEVYKYSTWLQHLGPCSMYSNCAFTWS